MPKRAQRAQPIDLVEETIDLDTAESPAELARGRRRRRAANGGHASMAQAGAPFSPVLTISSADPINLSPTPRHGVRGGAPAAASEDDVLASFICALPGCNCPCLVDKCAGVVHDYCSREHEWSAHAGQQSHAWAEAGHDGGAIDADAAALFAFECALPGCSAPAHVDYARGVVHDFCSREHALLHIGMGGGGGGGGWAGGGGSVGAGRTIGTSCSDLAHRLGLPPGAFGAALGGGGTLYAGGGRGNGRRAGMGGGGGGGGGGVRHDDGLDLDNMTHEEIIALSERIGSVRVGLTRRQLHHLPLERYRAPCRPAAGAGAGAGENERSEANCVICVCELEEGEEVRTLPCGHVFHRGCIDTWLLSDAYGAKSCPVCMKEVKV